MNPDPRMHGVAGRTGGTVISRWRVWLGAVQRRHAILFGVLALWGVVPGASPAAAQDPPASASQSEYERLVGLGLAAFEEERWTEAHALFDRAHALEPNARTLRARGVAAFQLARHVDALRDLEASLAHPRRRLTPELREAVLELIARIQGAIARVHVRHSPDDFEVQVDGVPATLDEGGALLLEPGEHVLRFSAVDHWSQERRVVATAGGVTELVVELAPLPMAASIRAAQPPAPPPAQPLPARAGVEGDGFGARETALVAAGASAALFGGAADFFWTSGEREVDSLARACNRHGCTPEQRARRIERSDVETFETLTNVSLGLSVAAVITGAVLYLALPDERGHSVAVGIDGRACTLSLGGRF